MNLVPLIHLQASPAALAMGFAVLLVLSLVTVEEVELRRGRPRVEAEG